MRSAAGRNLEYFVGRVDFFDVWLFHVGVRSLGTRRERNEGLSLDPGDSGVLSSSLFLVFTPDLVGSFTPIFELLDDSLGRWFRLVYRLDRPETPEVGMDGCDSLDWPACGPLDRQNKPDDRRPSRRSNRA